MDETRQRKTTQLAEAVFDPRLKTYVYVGGIFFFTITIIGIVLLPFWLIFGRIYINRYYNSLFCELTTRALHFKKGVWFQQERTIPLDKIQDLMFHEGPVLRYWGLSSLKIETASQNTQGLSDLTLTGIVDARIFREKVLDQRDAITDLSSSSSAQSAQSSTTASPAEDELIPLLSNIHETLKKIEQKIN